jgi:Cu(I)/Ag(I) efflux system membrane fusion protein
MLLISFSSIAQDKTITTATITVKGNCDECKNRIENAADIKGVKLATWDEKKQRLSVTYNTEKVSLAEIEKAIAASGHDAGSVKGTDAGYKKLPSCCKYRDKKCEAK